MKDVSEIVNHTTTSGERRARIAQLLAWLLESPRTRPENTQYCAEQWGVKESSADHYRADAWRLHGQLTEPQRNVERGKTRADIDRMAAKAWEDGNLMAFAKAIELRIKVWGLAAPDRVEIDDVTDKATRSFADEPEAVLIQRLAELRGNGGATPH